jgi:hypothetical protein
VQLCYADPVSYAYDKNFSVLLPREGAAGSSWWTLVPANEGTGAAAAAAAAAVNAPTDAGARPQCLSCRRRVSAIKKNDVMVGWR